MVPYLRVAAYVGGCAAYTALQWNVKPNERAMTMLESLTWPFMWPIFLLNYSHIWAHRFNRR
jgi:hypothetical protein